MNKTKIEWCTMTWNPVTGCLHDCPYCYARNFANRFGDHWQNNNKRMGIGNDDKLHIKYATDDVKLGSYPWDFEPTLHPERLKEPQCTKKPQNVFVGSMADLFGRWVPDEWIKEVFKACDLASRHRYLFLTKNPARYVELMYQLPKRFWYGTSITKPNQDFWHSYERNCFLSIEPIQSSFEGLNFASKVDWVIIGAETGNQKGKIIPERKWIEDIVSECRRAETSVFLKNSLAEIWGAPLIQEYPWEKG